jgi:HEAT repeat protein
MTRRKLRGISVAVAAVMLTLLAVPGFYVVPGLLKQEKFFRGLPTSYWRSQLKNWDRNKDQRLAWSQSPVGRVVDGLGLGIPSRWPLYRDPAAVPLLIDLLHDPDHSVRFGAAQATGYIGPPAAAAVPHLLELLETEDPLFRSVIAWQLARIGPAALPAVPLLIKDLRSWEGYGEIVAGAMRRFGRPAIPLLVPLLADPDMCFRRRVAWVLSGLKEEALPLTPNLEGDEQVARSAARAVDQLGSEAVRLLAGVLKDKDPEARRRAAGILGSLGLKAEVSVPDLKAALRDEDRQVRDTAAEALAKIVGKGPP